MASKAGDEALYVEACKTLDYIDGSLYRKIGYVDNQGYARVGVKGVVLQVHRIIFYMHYGYLPEMVDHIDGNKTNNKIENLRPVNRSQNMRNRKVRKDSSVGHKNVSYNKRNKKWVVGLRVGGVKKHIGTFADYELAELVAIEAREKFHGEFARH